MAWRFGMAAYAGGDGLQTIFALWAGGHLPADNTAEAASANPTGLRQLVLTAAEGLLAGPSRCRRCTPASYAYLPTRGARGGGPVSGARRPRAGRYRPSRPCPG